MFEVQFTAGQFGWVVVHLTKIDVDELTELVTEAWCLTAPKHLVSAYEADHPLLREPEPGTSRQSSPPDLAGERRNHAPLRRAL